MTLSNLQRQLLALCLLFFKLKTPSPLNVPYVIKCVPLLVIPEAFISSSLFPPALISKWDSLWYWIS